MDIVGEQYSDERLVEVAGQSVASVDALLERVPASVRAFASDAKQSVAIAMLAVRRV